MSDHQAATKPRNRRKIARQIDIPQDVFLAASVGDLEWLRHAVAGWNYKSETPYDHNGFTPLHVAAAHARLDCVKHFIEKLQYDVNLPSKIHGWLPVHVVVNHLNDERTLPCLNYLILKGANINGTNATGTTALHQAASEGDTDSIKVLLDRGANPLLEDARGCTPLQLAKIWGHRESARAIENAIWRLGKSNEAKQKQVKLESEKKAAIEDVKTAVEKFTAAPDDGTAGLGNWMRNHGLDDYSIKHNKVEREKSVHPGRRMQSTIPNPPESPFNRPRAEAMSRRHAASPQMVIKRNGEEVAQFNVMVEEDAIDFPAVKDVRTLSLDQLRAYHDKPWIKSTKVSECFSEYMPNLKDIYPRDEYSMTPTMYSTPFLCVGNIRETKNMEIISEPMRQIRYEGKGPPLSPRRYESTGRPVIFGAYRNILDIGPLRKPDQNSLPRDEAALHLVNDPNSYLFKFSLQPAVLQEYNKTICATTSSDNID